MDKRKFGQQDKRAFRKFADEHAPKSRTGVDCIFAFLTGGTICTIGQGIREMYTAFGIGEDAVKILTPCSLVLVSVVLTAFGIYEKIARFSGGGTLVPITGFANAVASCAIDAKPEGMVIGVGAKMFAVSGPVILYGTAASVVWGCIYYLVNYIFA